AASCFLSASSLRNTSKIDPPEKSQIPATITPAAAAGASHRQLIEPAREEDGLPCTPASPPANSQSAPVIPGCRPVRQSNTREHQYASPRPATSAGFSVLLSVHICQFPRPLRP